MQSCCGNMPTINRENARFGIPRREYFFECPTCGSIQQFLVKGVNMRNAIAVLVNGAYEIVPLSKWHLSQAFIGYSSAELYDSSGRKHVGKIISIGHEDGSGRSFNVTISRECFHIRTVD